MDFREAVKQRRTIYGLGKNINLSNERIREIVEYAVKHTPSAFNSQSARVVVLLGEHHAKLWSIVKESLRKIVSANAFPKTEEKINTFAAGYGTVLFFEDGQIIKALQEQFPPYKDNFPIWSQQSSGMLQYVVWTSFEAEGVGASIQHYNPLIDDAVKNQWDIPNEWNLISQMPFGAITASPNEKEFLPLKTRVKFFE